MVGPDYTATIGLDRDQARALVAAADADRGPQGLRTAAVIRLLVHNALRVDVGCPTFPGQGICEYLRGCLHFQQLVHYFLRSPVLEC